MYAEIPKKCYSQDYFCNFYSSSHLRIMIIMAMTIICIYIYICTFYIMNTSIFQGVSKRLPEPKKRTAERVQPAWVAAED